MLGINHTSPLLSSVAILLFIEMLTSFHGLPISRIFIAVELRYCINIFLALGYVCVIALI